MEIYDEIAQRLPKAFERYPNQRAVAVRLFCIECMGGSARDAVACQTSRCFLWPHRGKAWNDSAVAQGHRPADWADRLGARLGASEARSESGEG